MYCGGKMAGEETTLEIRCGSCGFHQFTVSVVRAKQLTPDGKSFEGTMQFTCCRCGSHEYGVMDPVEDKKLRAARLPNHEH